MSILLRTTYQHHLDDAKMPELHFGINDYIRNPILTINTECGKSVASIANVEFSKTVPTQTEIKAAAPLIEMVMDKYSGDLRKLFTLQRKLKKMRDSFSSDKYGPDNALTERSIKLFTFKHGNIRKRIRVFVEKPSCMLGFSVDFHDIQVIDDKGYDYTLMSHNNVTKEEQKVINAISKQSVEYKNLMAQVEHLQKTVSACSI